MADGSERRKKSGWLVLSPLRRRLSSSGKAVRSRLRIPPPTFSSHQQRREDPKPSFFTEAIRRCCANGPVLDNEDLQLSASHVIGLKTSVDITLQATRIEVNELRFRLLQRLLSCEDPDGRLGVSKGESKQRLWPSTDISLSLASDLQQRHRLTLESMTGFKEDKHTLSSVISSDISSGLAYGLASSHRLGKHWTTFLRYSKDDYAGERFVFQSVHDVNARNTISTVCAATVGRQPQGGFSWIYDVPEKAAGGYSRRSFQMNALGGGDGSYSLSFKAEVGYTDI